MLCRSCLRAVATGARGDSRSSYGKFALNNRESPNPEIRLPAAMSYRSHKPQLEHFSLAPRARTCYFVLGRCLYQNVHTHTSGSGVEIYQYSCTCSTVGCSYTHGYTSRARKRRGGPPAGATRQPRRDTDDASVPCTLGHAAAPRTRTSATSRRAERVCDACLLLPLCVDRSRARPRLPGTARHVRCCLHPID